MWATIALIIPIIVSILKFFGVSVDRAEQIEANMRAWLDKSASAGEILSQEQSELQKQDQELNNMRPKTFFRLAILGYPDRVRKLAAQVGCSKMGEQLIAKLNGHTPRYLTIFDISLRSNQPRLHLLDLQLMTVRSMLCGVGKGSDPEHTGKATIFSNVIGSQCTSLGVFKYSELFQSTNHGIACKLDGLDLMNSHMRERAILLHTAVYVTASDAGRTEGCEAVSQANADVIQKVHGGSLGVIGYPG